MGLKCFDKTAVSHIFALTYGDGVHGTISSTTLTTGLQSTSSRQPRIIKSITVTIEDRRLDNVMIPSARLAGVEEHVRRSTHASGYHKRNTVPRFDSSVCTVLYQAMLTLAR